MDKIEELLLENSIDEFSLEELIDEYCIRDWKYRGRCTGCDEIRKRLSITYMKKNSSDLNAILNYLEYIANLIGLCNTRFLQGRDDFDAEYQYLQENVIGLIEDMGYEAKIFEDEERVLLLEKNAAAMAVAEIIFLEHSNNIWREGPWNYLKLKSG